MIDPEDEFFHEICFPGAITDSTEVNCPHCGRLLTVQVNHPIGEQSYQCGECAGEFEVDWIEGTISHYPQAD